VNGQNILAASIQIIDDCDVKPNFLSSMFLYYNYGKLAFDGATDWLEPAMANAGHTGSKRPLS
jgi:hypothetical protein